MGYRPQVWALCGWCHLPFPEPSREQYCSTLCRELHRQKRGRRVPNKRANLPRLVERILDLSIRIEAESRKDLRVDMEAERRILQAALRSKDAF